MSDPELLKEPLLPRRLIAAQEIAAIERSWSAARSLSMEGLSSRERIARFAMQQAFYELVEIQGFEAADSEAILGLFADTPELANATLARIDMDGEWDSADAFERQLLGMLFDTNYRESIQWINRESEDAKRVITVPAGLTNEDNFVALRRKRRLVIASHLDGSKAKRRVVEVDKVSTFALDIAKLSELSDPAAAEVRLIVASTMYKAVDWDALRSIDIGLVDDPEALFDHLAEYSQVADESRSHDLEIAMRDFANLHAAMRRYEMTLDEVHYRAYDKEDPTRLHDQRGVDLIETMLHERNSLLTPAATTYYIHS